MKCIHIVGLLVYLALFIVLIIEFIKMCTTGSKMECNTKNIIAFSIFMTIPVFGLTWNIYFLYKKN
jgi:hypothetical protein